MSDFIKKAKQDKDINNGGGVISSRTDGSRTEHHTIDSKLSERTQANNEVKLENKFGDKFKYFDSAAEIRRIQTTGGGVNKTLSQIQSSLSAVKEKSETIIAKAEENKDFNSGGAVSNAGGGSKFSDTLQTNLSEKDQSDTATVLNENIGSSVKTGSNTGSQDSANIRQEIVNNDKAVAVADDTTDSDGLEKGGCPDAQTRGSSRLVPNLLNVNLTDENGNFGPSVAFFGMGSCDCYVPLNLPLLSALGKLAKIPGRMSTAVAKLFSEGKTFEGTLKHMGRWKQYLLKSQKAILDADYIEIDGVMKSLRDAQTAFGIALSKARRAYNDAVDALDSYTKTFEKAKADYAMYHRDIAKVDERLNFLGPSHPEYAAHLDLKQRLSKKQTEAALISLDYRELVEEAEKAKDAAESSLRSAQDAMDASEEFFNSQKKSTVLSDTMGVVKDVAGYPFEVLAAIDPSRRKVCLGPGTTLNKKTCTCECQEGHTVCAGGDPLTPAWSILDFISPVQSDELKRCYPPCPCNLKRTVGGLVASNCECTECKDGYTWYPGATCDCEKPTGYVGLNVVTRTTERGTCVQNEKVSSNTSLGKTWDTKGCGFKCGPDTDVGSNKHFGTYHRLSDNYPSVAPSKHHALYAQGCTYVCDGRDRPEGTPWPPDCGDGVFNTEKCECVPTNCPQYSLFIADRSPVLVLQDASYNIDNDTGEPLGDTFWSVYEYRTGGSKSGSPFMGTHITITDPGGDWAIYTDVADASGYEFEADPRRLVEWSSSRLRYKAFECNDDGTLGSEITGSVLSADTEPSLGGCADLECASCVQETYGPNPKAPPEISTTDTWLGCLSLNYGLVGISSVNPDIIP